MCKTIKQKVKFKAPPKEIYQLLADSKKYTAMSGKKAVIGKTVGSRFSVYGGQATGINVDLVPGKRIVRAWRGHSFPEGIFSMATFDLKPTPKGGTELTLTHRGVPKQMIPFIEKGWRKYCWDKIKSYLESRD